MKPLIKFTAILIIVFISFQSKVYTQSTDIKNDTKISLNQQATSEKSRFSSDADFDKYLKEKNIGRQVTSVKGEDTSYWKEFSQMMLVLGGILIFLITAGWLLKKMLNARISSINFSSCIKILDKRALHPKACIYYIEVDGKRFVVGEGQNHLSMLTEIPKSDQEVEECSEIQSVSKDKGVKFASFLKSCVSKKSSGKIEV